MPTVKSNLWDAYSWEPSTKVPGGRKRRVSGQYTAESRVEAKDAFLRAHPEELPYQVAASRVKDVAIASSEAEKFEHEGPGLPQKFEAAEAPIKVTAAMRADAFYPEVEATIAKASNPDESFSARYSAISYLRGSSRVRPTSDLSKYSWSEASRLSELLYATPEQK